MYISRCTQTVPICAVLYKLRPSACIDVDDDVGGDGGGCGDKYDDNRERDGLERFVILR